MALQESGAELLSLESFISHLDDYSVPMFVRMYSMYSLTNRNKLEQAFPCSTRNVPLC